jgi:two-component system CheB/CheR fusion protein
VGNTVVGSDSAVLDLLLEKIYRDGGRDFREYKRSTIMRRLERRLNATGSKTYLDYMLFLDAHPEEYQQLANDLTIKVSSFFRSRYAFEQVARLVLPELVSHKRSRGKYSMRFWSTACARGEEPYSIAILLAEFLGYSLPDFDVSIRATDISWWALGEAQAGIYTPKDIESLPPAILESYFTPNGECYEVRNNIRQMVSFSYFDLASTTKPSFLELDCIFCCNVLIYLQHKLQERILNMLYDLLATPGYLVLGEVETPTNNLGEKLECLDSKAKIYKKNRGG